METPSSSPPSAPLLGWQQLLAVPFLSAASLVIIGVTLTYTHRKGRHIPIAFGALPGSGWLAHFHVGRG